MLVYGAASETICPCQALAALAGAWKALETVPAGIEAHAALVGLLVDAAGIAQGLADFEFESAGQDVLSAIGAAAMRLLCALAADIDLSWRNGFQVPAPRDGSPAVPALAALGLPAEIRSKRQEGFAFYAVYPEAYLKAARALPAGLHVRVIGIRSIGIGLAALVGCGVASRRIATVRPVGHPFDRRVRVGPGLAEAMTAGSPDAFAIVDEGPGLSGSSFGAVADFLEAAGAERQRIHFFPSHGGDLGAKASARHRARWHAAARHAVDFDMLALEPEQPWQGLLAWVGDLAGGRMTRLRDISGGAWRGRRYADATDWPPADVQQERRKFLLETPDGEGLLLKFAGLGRYGSAKLARARTLSAAGFSPRVLGLRHGFIVEPWLTKSRPLDLDGVDRGVLVDRLGDYLGFRARHFAMGPDSGAPLAKLAAMLRHNAGEGLGREFAAAFDTIEAELGALESAVRPVATDNRLHVWEWLQMPDGSLLKADAVDHCEAHDLVGCQDIAWDVAGACIEFGLSGDELSALSAGIARRSGRPVDARLVAGLRPCYLAFQLGAYRMAADALAMVPDESARLASRAAHYADLLWRIAQSR